MILLPLVLWYYILIHNVLVKPNEEIETWNSKYHWQEVCFNPYIDFLSLQTK